MKYSQEEDGDSYWIFPKGGEVSKGEIYAHGDLLKKVDACRNGYHSEAFDLGFLRVTVTADELNLQWVGY